MSELTETLDAILARGINELTPEDLVKMTCDQVEQAMAKAVGTNTLFYMDYRQREDFIAKYGFSVPCREAYERIKQSDKLIGIGSGTGYWEKVLGIPAFDDRSGEYSFDHDNEYVQTMSAVDAVKAHPDCDVFCSWPSLDGMWFTEAVEAMQPGRTLYYIGEDYMGCTAHESFYNLECTERVEHIYIPQWNGMHDYLQIYRIK